MKTQEWRLLRYLDSILLRLYKKDTTIRYSQYNLSWQVLNRLRWDGSKFKSLAANLSKQLHISSSTLATFNLPYILFCMKNDFLELVLDDTYDELIEKEIELGGLPVKYKRLFADSLLDSKQCVCHEPLEPGHPRTKNVEDFKKDLEGREMYDDVA